MRVIPLPYQILGFVSISFLLSCSVSKHLPPGTQLYKGAQYEIRKDKANKTKIKTVKNLLKDITSPVPNKTIFGFPYKVAFWYAIGEPKKEKGFRYWLRSKFGEAPILNTSVNAKATAVNFKYYLENKGFFKTNVSGDTTVKGYKVTANYKIDLGIPYKINEYKWILDSTSQFGKDIRNLPPDETLIKKGTQYDLDNIKAERDRAEVYLKSVGYYYFAADHIKAYVDSSKGGHVVNIFFTLKPAIPAGATLPQTIRSITLFPNYTLITPPPDTSKTGLTLFNGIYIRDTIKNTKPAALVRPVTYRPQSLYSIKNQNRTLNRFINMGIFKFAKNRYAGDGDTLHPKFLDVYYYLTPLPAKSFQTELGVFSKSNSFTGVRASITWRNRNLFKGAEQLYIKTYGSFESSGNSALQANNNFSLGTDVSLLLPRFVTPFKIHESNFFPPKTKFTIGYEWFRRQALYTKNSFRFQYELIWKEQVNKEHILSPINIIYNTTSAFSPQYQLLVSQVPVLAQTNLPEVIIGSSYNYSFHSRNTSAKSVLYFNGNLDAAGNTIGLFSKINGPYSSKIAGAYFSQYVKFETDLRYSTRLNVNTWWANRIIVGAGFPYGNSAYLPFSRQFTIGGASSIRGFQPRQLGPGRSRANSLQQLYLPLIGGDYKLEANSEMRFPLFSKLKGAVFIDAGNIWTKDSVLYGATAQFNSHFLQDIAVSGGVGFRLDISILIIRLDIAAPFREPYLERGKEWVIGDFQPFSSTWRKQNLVYNIAIGYPF